MNINQQYMYMLRFNIVRCVFLLFYVLMKILFYMCEYSDAIKLPKYYSPRPPPVVGRGCRLSHFCLAKEVEVKKKLQQQCL